MKITPYYNILVPAMLLALVLISVGLTSCTPKLSQSKEISPAELLRIRDTHTLNHTVYSGSDDEFHYFTHHSLDKSLNAAYKVRRTAMSIPGEYPVGQQAPDLFLPITTDDGTALIVPHSPPTTSGEQHPIPNDRQRPTAKDYEALKAYFPDIRPGEELPYADAQLLPMEGLAYSWYDNTVGGLAESGDREEVWAIGKLLDYEGYDIFIISHLMERADEDTYDNHSGPTEHLILFRDGMSVSHEHLPAKVVGSSYYGEGGTADMNSAFNRDTTLTTTWRVAEQESATGYQTPIVTEYARQWRITLPGRQPEPEILLYVKYSSPYFDAGFLADNEADWRRYDYRHYPTRDDKWQLDWMNNESGGDTYLYFYVADIDGMLRTVFETHQPDAEVPVNRYVLGQPDKHHMVDARGTPAGTDTTERVTLVTSDGIIELLPDGRFALSADAPKVPTDTVRTN